MSKYWHLLGALCCLPAWAAPAGSPGSQQSPGMVITGDREAPLVLYIVPWQEPKALPPPAALMQTLLPNVIDYNRSLIEDPLNRSEPPKLERSTK